MLVLIPVIVAQEDDDDDEDDRDGPEEAGAAAAGAQAGLDATAANGVAADAGDSPEGVNPQVLHCRRIQRLVHPCAAS
jgi:hypothetical protein